MSVGKIAAVVVKAAIGYAGFAFGASYASKRLPKMR